MSYLGLGQSDVLKSVLGKALDPLTESLKSKALEIAKPAAQELATAIQPMIREELDRQVPTFALYAGLALGALVLIGIITGVLTTKERVRTRS